MSLNSPDQEDTTLYSVVVNRERQYSIWPDYKELPPGWESTGKVGTKAESLAYIKEVWRDMTPLSLVQNAGVATDRPTFPSSDPPAPLQKSLVDRLCEGDHAVEVSPRPRTAQMFKDALDRNYFHLKFTQTQGGTDLGISLDREHSDLGSADFERGEGNVHVEGNLTLDYVKVKCMADIDLSTLKGTGHLAKCAEVSAS
jgi:uncharacterized protein YbdZ (MbtH family)